MKKYDSFEVLMSLVGNVRPVGETNEDNRRFDSLEELAEATGVLATLRDPTALSDAYHGLKGAALNLGFSRLAELAPAAEQDPSSADPGTISAVCQSSAKALLDRHPGIAS